jgi:hypothetical protein
MRTLILLSVFLPFSAAFSAEKIHSVSNLAGSKAVVEIAAPERRLVMLDLSSGKRDILPLPATEEEVMGTILLADRLLLISQWTAGDGKPAHLHELSFKTKVWADPREIECISFDQISVSGNELRMSCETGPNADSKPKDVVMKFGGRPEMKLKLEFPLASYVRDKFSFRLVGNLMAWDSLETKTPTGKKKVYKANELKGK